MRGHVRMELQAELLAVTIEAQSECLVLTSLCRSEKIRNMCARIIRNEAGVNARQ